MYAFSLSLGVLLGIQTIQSQSLSIPEEGVIKFTHMWVSNDGETHLKVSHVINAYSPDFI
jgi:hypothetical protein